MSLDPEEPYSVAKGYVQSAFAMMTNPYRLQLPDDITLFMAFHMLCGFAAELYFKAFLAHKGYSDAQLRKPKIGHDLTWLRASAGPKGCMIPALTCWSTCWQVNIRIMSFAT
jgi:hypothetical protein